MKQFITRRSFIKAAGAATALTAVSVGAPAAFAEETNCFFGDKADVTILYTNDVHTYIDNKSPKPTYAAIAALKKSIEDTGRDVLLVDAGDHIQGTAYGSMDDGATIIELMNEAGYDLATPGNHEFDYGMARAKAVLREADFPYVSCNWVDLRTGLNVLPSVKFFFVGGRKIAFVGVTTPETFTKSTPAYFMNDAQTKYIYDILGGEDGQKLYDAVQKAIDKAEFWGADTIIGLGHLGVDPSSSPWTSEEVIAHTHGFTAFIDGHSHTVMANKQVTDASGKAVTLTQTGSYFKNIGKMTVGADGTITTELIDTYEGLDAAVAATASNWISAVDDMLGEEIAVGDTKFYINDPATGKRRIRSGETNLGDFVADGIYTYFNEVEKLHCDVAIMNGGGIRPDPLPQVPQRLQALGLVLIVGVQKGDIGPPDMVKAHIPGLADAAVALLVEHPDAVILPGQLIAESRGAVGAAVIHQQQLPVGKGLPPYALHAVSEKFLRLIDRHNDGNAGHRQPPCALRRLSSVYGAETPAPSPQNLGLLHGAIVPDFPGKVNVFSRKSRAY